MGALDSWEVAIELVVLAPWTKSPEPKYKCDDAKHLV